MDEKEEEVRVCIRDVAIQRSFIELTKTEQINVPHIGFGLSRHAWNWNTLPILNALFICLNSNTSSIT